MRIRSLFMKRFIQMGRNVIQKVVILVLLTNLLTQMLNF